MAWYSKVEFREGVKFEQGDFIQRCPFYSFVSQENDKAKVVTAFYDVVVITQSCDLANDKADRVLVAPWKPLPYYLERQLQAQQRGNPSKTELNAKEKRRFFDNLKDGIFHRYHLLDRWPEGGLDEYPVVDFGFVFSVSLPELTRIALGQQAVTRLNSPYKEHLSQAFARYFMRVGLPSSIRNPF